MLRTVWFRCTLLNVSHSTASSACVQSSTQAPVADGRTPLLPALVGNRSLSVLEADSRLDLSLDARTWAEWVYAEGTLGTMFDALMPPMLLLPVLLNTFAGT